MVVILAQNTEAILPAVERHRREHPGHRYDRLIEHADVLYTSFDNVRVGEMQAEAVLPWSAKATSWSSRATATMRTPTSCARA